MASASDKSEKPTASKLRKARDKGDIPRSKELSLAAGLIAAFGTVVMCLPYYRQLISESFASVAMLAGRAQDETAIPTFLLTNVLLLIRFFITLIPIPLAALLASLVPGGWIFAPARLKPDLKKINPVNGAKRLVSASHYVEVGKMALKCSCILLLLYLLIAGSFHDMQSLQYLTLNLAINKGYSVSTYVVSRLLLVTALFAMIDVPLSRFSFTKKMRMTRQEVKEEYKNNDGNPLIKGRIRQLQRQMAMRQINRTVPEANVIIANPTHYSVALKYDPQKASAPYIVAKGVDDVALHIQEVARKHQVEIVTFPPLARAVYYTTQVNQQIPASLFRAIAQILTYVMQLKNWREGRTAQKPQLNRNIDIPREVLKKHGSE